MTFDPFMSLSVPIPKNLRHLPIIFIPKDPDQLPRQVGVLGERVSYMYGQYTGGGGGGGGGGFPTHTWTSSVSPSHRVFELCGLIACCT